MANPITTRIAGIYGLNEDHVREDDAEGGHGLRIDLPYEERVRQALGGRVYRNTALQSTLRVNADGFSAKTAIISSAFTVRSIPNGDFV